ncbi:MAG TPA: phosphatidate cytidylyltransferase [Bacteroidales bacterium]|nr:phosphatidate cytidylyltransferase [Bacteroidales bacterium]
MSNFLRRTLTAVWIVVFILGGFWLHPITFFITGIVLLTGAQYEYYLIVRSRGTPVQMVNGIITGAALYIISTLVAAGHIDARFFLLIFIPAFLTMTNELYRRQEKPFDSLAHTFFGVIYIAFPFSLFPFAAFSQTGMNTLVPHGAIAFSPGIIVGFLLLLWANDTAAYLTGMTIGRHRLMERISPRKSWEGFFGGLFITVLAAWLLSGWFGVVNTAGWIVIALIISVTGTFGDLFESMFKRSMGVKDSGNILPGHGGFLDRFDSAIVSFPLVYLFIALFG